MLSMFHHSFEKKTEKSASLRIKIFVSIPVKLVPTFTYNSNQMKKIILRTILLSSLMSCQPNPGVISEAPVFTPIPTPVIEGGEANLFVTDDDQVYLSWVEYLNDTIDDLRFSKLEDGYWSTPSQIAQGTDWFVNWADFPSLAVFTGEVGHLAAHWLQKSDVGIYDYDVRISLSRNDGKNWSPSFIPHKDSIAAEHGFASMLPLPNGRMFAVWLDGRYTKGHREQNGTHSRTKAMTLRTAEFDIHGNIYEETELDSRICDCCQTDAALTSNGPIVVYRDRSLEEIRDIAIVRKIAGEWTAPRKIFNDDWKIAGCPVNGPAITTQGQNVAIAWYTGAKDKPQVKVVFSEDAGANFSNPILIDDGHPLGRVDIVLVDEQTALVSWLEQLDEQGEIRLAKVNTNEKVGSSVTVTITNVSRQSGFPILEQYQEQYMLAWTQVDSLTRIKTTSFSW